MNYFNSLSLFQQMVIAPIVLTLLCYALSGFIAYSKIRYLSIQKSWDGNFTGLVRWTAGLINALSNDFISLLIPIFLYGLISSDIVHAFEYRQIAQKYIFFFIVSGPALTFVFFLFVKNPLTIENSYSRRAILFDSNYNNNLWSLVTLLRLIITISIIVILILKAITLREINIEDLQAL